MNHRVLRRQLRRLGLHPSRSPADDASWTAFLGRVDAAYATADQERYLLERSFTLSSDEMQELHASLRLREAQQSALRRVATAVASEQQPAAVFDLVADEAAALISAESAGVVRFVGDRAFPVGVWDATPISTSDRDAREKGIALDDDGVLARIFRTGKAESIGPGEECGTLDVDDPARAAIAAPIRLGGRTWGAVVATAAGGASLPIFGQRVLGDLAHLVAMAIANSEARRELARRATTDPLTGLPNRPSFDDAVRASLGDAAAVLLMDLNDFKNVNDTLGHAAGDELLREVSSRLRGALDDCCVLARLGGDEFAVLIPGSVSRSEIVAVVERIRRTLREPVLLGDILVEVAASVGVALAPADGRSPGELIQHADVAMYAAKRGTTGFAIYAPEQDHHSPQQLAVVADLRRGLRDDEIVVHYQPKISVATGEVAGVEALVRWQHPERGLLSPGAFVPAAEQTALIKPLTLAVVQRALRQGREWDRIGLPLDVAINVSAKCLIDPLFPGAVGRAVDRAGVRPGAVELEITESALMADPDRARAAMAELRRRGVSMAIDDFGTGYSSLGYLKNLPLDVLKIDRSFVSRMATDRTDAMIVRSTVELAHNLELRTVAEGVEDGTQLRELRAMGCDTAQGFLFAGPMPPEEITEWVISWDRRSVPGVRSEPGS